MNPEYGLSQEFSWLQFEGADLYAFDAKVSDLVVRVDDLDRRFLDISCLFTAGGFYYVNEGKDMVEGGVDVDGGNSANETLLVFAGEEESLGEGRRSFELSGGEGG